MIDLFADTYALIEILKGNPNYEDYSERLLITTEFNLFELAYALYRDFGNDAVNYPSLPLYGKEGASCFIPLTNVSESTGSIRSSYGAKV